MAAGHRPARRGGGIEEHGGARCQGLAAGGGPSPRPGMSAFRGCRGRWEMNPGSRWEWRSGVLSAGVEEGCSADFDASGGNGSGGSRRWGLAGSGQMWERESGKPASGDAAPIDSMFDRPSSVQRRSQHAVAVRHSSADRRRTPPRGTAAARGAAAGGQSSARLLRLEPAKSTMQRGRPSRAYSSCWRSLCPWKVHWLPFLFCSSQSTSSHATKMSTSRWTSAEARGCHHLRRLRTSRRQRKRVWGRRVRETRWREAPAGGADGGDVAVEVSTPMRTRQWILVEGTVDGGAAAYEAQQPTVKSSPRTFS